MVVTQGHAQNPDQNPQNSASQAILEKRYDDMKRYYEGRIRELEREILDYKQIVSNIN